MSDAQTLAQLVRAKYPGAYDSLTDPQLEAAVKAKYPGVYDHVPTTPVTAPPTSASPTVMQRVVGAAATAAPAVGGGVGALAGAATGPVGRMAASAVGGAAGQGYGDLIAHAKELPGAAADVVRNLVTQPAATVRGFEQGAGEGADAAAKQALTQAGAQGIGEAALAGAKGAAPWLMQSALKPGVAVLKEYRTTAPAVVQTLLDNGVSVTEAGVAKLQRLLGATNDAIRDAVQSASGTIQKNSVIARVLPTAAKLAQQVNPTADLQAVGDTVSEFANHPVFKGPTLSVPEAQAMKVGTYQQIGKKYGQVSSAAIETQKALARGLKEDIAAEVPGLAGLNATDSELMAALDATGRRVALSGNKDPVGFAWVAAHPTTFLAALLDRNPAVKSLIARGLWNSAGAATQVAPDLIRAAVAAVTSVGSDASPVPGSSDSAANPGRR